MGAIKLMSRSISTRIFGMLCIEISNNQEVVACIERELAVLKVNNGAIVSLFGAFDSCCISNMPEHDAKVDVLMDYHLPLEVSGCGDIRNGKVHIHVTASSVNQLVLAGHLHWARSATWFVRAYILPMDAQQTYLVAGAQ